MDPWEFEKWETNGFMFSNIILRGVFKSSVLFYNSNTSVTHYYEISQFHRFW